MRINLYLIEMVRVSFIAVCCMDFISFAMICYPFGFFSLRFWAGKGVAFIRVC